MSRTRTDNVPSALSKKEGHSIKEIGKIGRDVLNDIVSSVTYLKPVKGRIMIEVNLMIEDEKFFGDDEVRNSKLLIELELEKPEE